MITLLLRTLLVLYMLFVITKPLYSQNPATESVVVQPRVMSPREYILGDTSRYNGNANIPGDVSVRFSPVQDSIYSNAMALQISAITRFRNHTVAFSELIRLSRELQPEPSPWERALSNLNIPSSIYEPTAQQTTQHTINIANSMYVPGVLMFPMGTGNAMVNLGDIGSFLGLTEDVSPQIKYVVNETTFIKVVVYSTQAKIVSVLFSGIQQPGGYEVVWNGTDEKGKPVPNGDYIAEVQHGTNKIMRKRILISGH